MNLDHTRHWKRNVWMMVLSQSLVMAGFSAAMPFIPLYLKEGLGIVSDADRGLYTSLFTFFGFFAYAIFNPLWGSLSDRYGVKPMLLRGTFVTAIFFPMMAYVTNVWLLIALRFITAACAGTTVASQTLVVKNTPENRQGFALGMLTTAFWSGSMLGNVLGGLVVSYCGYASTFWFCGILYFLAGIFVLFAKDDYIPMRDSGCKKERPKFSWRTIIPAFTISVWQLMALTLLAGIAFSFASPYLPMLIEQIIGMKDAPFWTGITSAAAAVGSIFSGMITGYLSDRVKPLPLLLPIFVLMGIFLFVQALSPNLFPNPDVAWSFFGKSYAINLNLLTLGACRVLIMLVVGGSGAIFMKMLSASTPKRKRGAVVGFRSTAHQLGGMIASCAAGGVVYCFDNVKAVFYCASILTLLLIPLTIYIVREIEKKPFYASHCSFKK